MKSLFTLVAVLSILFISCRKEEKIIDDTKPRLETGYFKDVVDLVYTDTCLTFISIGDWGAPGDGLIAVSNQMDSVADYLSVEFILTAGDNFYPNGVDSINDPYWDVYTENFNQSSLQIPWYISVGNHDHHGSIQAQIDYSEIDERWNFPSHFYDLNMDINGSGDSLGIIVIDSQALRTDPDDMGQGEWISTTAQQMDHKWKLMLGHHNLYSYGHHGQSNLMISLLEDVLNTNEIDYYIAGHEHDMQYLETDGYTKYIVSGSAARTRPTDTGPYSLFALSELGFSLYRVSKHKLEHYFIDQYGEVVFSTVEEK